MKLDEAYTAVQFYGDMFGIYNLWEALEQMEKDYSKLDLHDRVALRKVRQDLEHELKQSTLSKKDVKIYDEDDGYLD